MRNHLATVPWNNARAIKHYRERCEIFDKLVFDKVTPITFDMTPWPVLKHPLELTIEDITSENVEEFFNVALKHRYVPYEDLKLMIPQSAVRWHPDKWRARGIFISAGGDAGAWEALVTEIAKPLLVMRDEVRNDKFLARLTQT